MSPESEGKSGSAIHPENARKISQILIKWGRKNYQDFPWRNPSQPWQGLIAEVLLQRTRAQNVLPVYLNFIKEFPSPSALACAPVEKIEFVIFSLGLRWRAPLLKQLGSQLEQNNGEIPKNLEELRALAGVGPYAAAAWLSFHGEKRGVIIDANVVRFICRLVDQPWDGETRREKWVYQTADAMTPPKNWKSYNYAVLDFTMQICTKQPKCEICPLGIEICQYFHKKSTKGGITS